MLAPASKAALLKNPPGAHLVSPVELNVYPVQEKSVPTFSLQGFCSITGRAARAEPPPSSVCIQTASFAR